MKKIQNWVMFFKKIFTHFQFDPGKQLKTYRVWKILQLTTVCLYLHFTQHPNFYRNGVVLNGLLRAEKTDWKRELDIQ